MICTPWGWRTERKQSERRLVQRSAGGRAEQRAVCFLHWAPEPRYQHGRSPCRHRCWRRSAATLRCWSGAGSLSLCPLSFSACPLMPWCLSQDFSRDVVCCHCHSQGLEAIRDVYSGILCQEEPRGSHVLESKGVPCWQSLHVGLDRERLLISGLGS